MKQARLVYEPTRAATTLVFNALLTVPVTVRVIVTAIAGIGLLGPESHVNAEEREALYQIHPDLVLVKLSENHFAVVTPGAKTSVRLLNIAAYELLYSFVKPIHLHELDSATLSSTGQLIEAGLLYSARMPKPATCQPQSESSCLLAPHHQCVSFSVQLLLYQEIY